MTSSYPIPDKSWQIIYPVYLNKTKTFSEGRRLPRDQCVENPSVFEMAECCKFLQIPFSVEHKAYSRDYMQVGRLRVLIKKKGVAVDEKLRTKSQVMRQIAELIALLPKRSPAPTTAELFATIMTGPPQFAAAMKQTGLGGGTAGENQKEKKKKKK